MDCCSGEDSTPENPSTFSQIVSKIQETLVSILNGDFQSSEDSNNVIVSVLFFVHITVVVIFLAHHCSSRGAVANYH